MWGDVGSDSFLGFTFDVLCIGVGLRRLVDLTSSPLDLRGVLSMRVSSVIFVGFSLWSVVVVDVGVWVCLRLYLD